MVEVGRLELPTTALSEQHSNQLNYTSICMALGTGLEPVTYRLTADCPTIEPPQNILCIVGGEGFEPPMFTLWERIYSPLQHRQSLPSTHVYYVCKSAFISFAIC